ncbi:MAG: MBL fold metallo-hydrolase [Candidatus Nanohaloarchaea archaeon]
MKIEVLGNVQDGGVPHLACNCEICEEAREDPEKRKYIASLMLKKNSDEDSVRYLIDATPDIRHQIKGDYLDGVFISHGQLGHITGLLEFGEEGCDKNDLPVYVTDKTREYIERNDPYRLLVDRGNIDLKSFNDGESLDIQGAEIEAHEAEHNRLNTDTTSFMIEGPEKKLFYMSDIHTWTEKTLKSVREADIAIVDGTFWNEEEIDRYEEVAHPVMKETMHKAEDWDTDIYFTHLNHTNPALRPESEEREELEERGFNVVQKGMEFEI